MRKIIRYVFLIIIAIVILIGLLIYRFFFSMNSLPKGELIDSIDSPNGNSTVNVYLVRGSATVSEAIRCEVIFNARLINKSRNIYWKYRQSEVNITWLNDQIIKINEIFLDINKDTYDFRQDKNDE